MAGKQAKILSPREIGQAIAHVRGRRYALRNEVLLLLCETDITKPLYMNCMIFNLSKHT